MVDALERALAEPDATEADVDVENNPQSSNSPREGPACCLEGVVDYDDDTDDAEVETLLFAPPSPSSSLVRPSLSPPRTYVGTRPPMRDGSPEVPSPPSYPSQYHRPGPSEMRRGGASSAAAQHGEVIVKLEEDQDDEMLPPSPVAVERPLEPAMPLERYKEKKALVTFPGKEVDEEMYTVFDYVVEPDPERHEGNISQLSFVNSFEGVTSLTLSFECPGSRDEDEDRHQGRRPDAIIETLRRLGAVLGRSLRGLDVTAPWPELSFPCVPGILEIILGSFPALGNVRFADLQCGCANCESVYTDPASFRRLQVAALQRQVSGPLTAAAMLQTVVIERKSMYSLGKDFMKYIGDADRLADEAMFGTCTVTKGEDPAGATARSQQEALSFARLLKRYLPSVLHFLVVTRELQVVYDAPPSPTESLYGDSVRSSKSPQADPERDTHIPALPSFSRSQTPDHHESSPASSCVYAPPPDAGIPSPVNAPPFDVSGDICPQDDIFDEPAATQDVDYVNESLHRDAFAQARDGRPLDVQTQGSDDADPTLAGGIHDVTIADTCDWWSKFISMAEDDGGLAISAESADIGVVSPLASFLVSEPSPAESLFGDGEFYSGPSPSLLDDPWQHWVRDVDRNELHIPLEDTANAEDAGLPPGWLQYDDSAVMMSDEFHLDAASFTGPMGGSWFDGAGPTDFATTKLSDDAVHSTSVDHLLACGYSEALGYDCGIDRGSDSVSLDGNVELHGENGEPGLYMWEDMDVFVS